MGKQKQIYLSDELYEQCKNINASEIISKLLIEYFNSKKSEAELITETMKLKEEKEKIVAEVDEKIEKLEIEVKKVQTIEEKSKEEEEREQHKLADKTSACINNAKEMFNIDLTEQQAVEFLNSEFTNILKFLEA